MDVNFFDDNCHYVSSRKTFGLCDDVSATGDSSDPAYLDEQNGANWIATIDNYHQNEIHFYAVDHCVKFPPKPDGKPSKQCDGMLVWNDMIAFVELKSSNQSGADWVKEGEKQLKTSIALFEATGLSISFSHKRAYIANNQRPRSRTSQMNRMERFLVETGYVLYIKARIELHSIDG